jgi:membrane protease YdiL (CAAX protease family)
MPDDEEPNADREPSEEEAGGVPNAFVRVAIAFEAMLLVVAWLVGEIVERPALAAFQWDWQAVVWGLAAAAPMLGLMFVGMRLPFEPIQRLRKFSEGVVAPMFAGSSWSDLLLVSVLAGVGEEMMFRGVMQHAVTTATGAPFGVWTGLAVGSVTFGLAHSASRTYAILAGVIGLYLGGLLLLTGNLLAPIVAHAAYDFGAFLYLLHDRSEMRAEDMS